MATEADKIFEALSNKFTGEVNAKEFIDKVFFGENSEYLNEFHDKFKKELFNPVKNRLGVVFKMIQRRLDSIKPDTIDYITDPFDNLKKFSNDVNNKTEEWLAALDEKYKKLLEKDEATPTTSNKPTPIEMASVSSTKAVEVLPSKIQQATTKTETKPIKQQAGFDPQVQLVEFDGKTEGFFKSLFNKFKIDDKTKKVAQDSTSGGFSYGGILGDGIQILLAGLAGLVGAFMTNGPMKGTLELIGKGGLRGGLALLSKTLFKDFAKTALKKVPIIGALYSYSLAWQRLNSGDTIGGILDIASGTASLFPVVGTAISIGIDVLQAILDAKSGGSSAEASGKKLKILGDWGASLYNILKKTPIIKTFITAGEGIWEFFSSFATGDINSTKSGLKKMSEFPILGIWPSLLGSVLDATTVDSSGKISGFNWNKFSDDFSNNIKMTVLSWIPDIGDARSIVAKALGIILPEGESSNMNQINAATVAASKAQREGKPVLKYSQENNKKAEDDYNQKKEAYEKYHKQFGQFKGYEEEDEKYKKQMEDAANKLAEQKKGLKETPNESFKYSEDEFKKSKKDFDEKTKKAEELRTMYWTDDYKKAELERLNAETLYRSLQKQKNQKSKAGAYYSVGQSQSDIKDFSNESPIDDNSQGSIDIEDEVFSIKDNKGTRYIPDKNDTLVVSKPDGALNKTLLEIKQVMIGVHKSIRELPKNQSNPSVMPVNVNNTSNSTGGEISSRDSIFNMRSEYWFKTPPIGRVTV